MTIARTNRSALTPRKLVWRLNQVNMVVAGVVIPNSQPFFGNAAKPPISATPARPGNSHVLQHAFCVPDSHTFPRNRVRSHDDSQKRLKASSKIQRFTTLVLCGRGVWGLHRGRGAVDSSSQVGSGCFLETADVQRSLSGIRPTVAHDLCVRFMLESRPDWVIARNTTAHAPLCRVLLLVAGRIGRPLVHY